MSQVEIVHLDTYRRRRDARFRQALALHAHEEDQEKILEHLWHALAVVGGDRGGVVWLDEYGPGLAHPHTLLDLGADRPRRAFQADLLRCAWDWGVPGLVDLHRPEEVRELAGAGIASACAISLGSDGPRSWFLVVDSLTPRPPLSDRAVGKLMFLAGEVASVVLHQDMDALSELVPGQPGSGVGGQEGPVFAGWYVLQDMEDEGQDEEVEYQIRNRFLIARLLRNLAEDHLVMAPDSLAYQLRGIRRELQSPVVEHPEARSWHRILDSVEAGEFGEVAGASLELGRVVEEQGHLNGALEILELAYELARATGSASAAADAARFQGKIYRTRGEWDRAESWYEVARTLSEHSGDRRMLATVLDGLANAYRDRGNLPRARESLREVLEIGEDTGDRYVLAIGHHDLMTVEKEGGELLEAIRQGWLAVQSYESRDGRLRALFDLAGVLREQGELSAARDAYRVVAAQVEGQDARVLTMDALAYVAALEGDREEHQALRDRMDVAGWEELSPVYRGQILYFRGLSHGALGEEEEARAWLDRALAFAEEHRFNKLIFDAETALRESLSSVSPQASPPYRDEGVPEEILGVRRGLREMREAQAGVGEGA
jgi:tetratricopeptide (TPR) repeat protein